MTSDGGSETRWLALHPDGQDILLDWWASPHASETDRELVKRLVRQLLEGGLRACTFYREPEITDPSITNILPRDGLVVAVRMLSDEPESFTIISIHPIE